MNLTDLIDEAIGFYESLDDMDYRSNDFAYTVGRIGGALKHMRTRAAHPLPEHRPAITIYRCKECPTMAPAYMHDGGVSVRFDDSTRCTVHDITECSICEHAPAELKLMGQPVCGKCAQELRDDFTDNEVLR